LRCEKSVQSSEYAIFGVELLVDKVVIFDYDAYEVSFPIK